MTGVQTCALPILNARVDRQRALRSDRKRIAVGRREFEYLEADDAVRTGTVVDDHLLAEALGQLLADDARGEVDAAARRKRHDHADRLRWIGLRKRRLRARQRCGEQRDWIEIGWREVASGTFAAPTHGMTRTPDGTLWFNITTSKGGLARINPKTKAIVVTHLFGNPCDMAGIMAVAKTHNLPVIEDCAQAFLTSHGDRYVGTIGTIGCFSLQQGKHITTGEGGVCVTDDEQLARRIYLFINKGWGYGDKNPDHYFLAPNYRMSELQGACALGQLPKLEGVVESRVRTATALTSALTGVRGIQAPRVTEGGVHVYWKYCLRVDDNVIEGGAVGLAAALKDKGVMCVPRYIQKPAFRCQIFRDQVTFGKSRWPFTLARPDAVDYSEDLFPGTFNALQHVVVLPWNEKYTQEHVDYIAENVREAVAQCTKSDAAVCV